MIAPTEHAVGIRGELLPGWLISARLLIAGVKGLWFFFFFLQAAFLQLDYIHIMYMNMM